MFQNSADLLAGWLAETEIIHRKIITLRAGETGHSLTPSQREAIINHHLEVIAEFGSLIADLCRIPERRVAAG